MEVARDAFLEHESTWQFCTNIANHYYKTTQESHDGLKELLMVVPSFETFSRGTRQVKEGQKKHGFNGSQEEESDWYTDYLFSDYWKNIRLIIHTRDKVCRTCRSDEMLEVHHSTYDFLGNEHIKNDHLILLCSKCHKGIHASAYIPRPKTIPNLVDGIIQSEYMRLSQ